MPRLATAFLLLVSLALPMGDVVAVDNLDARLAGLSGEGWQAVGISSSLHLGEGGRAELELEIQRFSLTEPPTQLGPLRLRCPLTGLDSGSLRCGGGRLSIAGAGLDQQELGVDLNWNAATGNLDLGLRGVHLGGGVLDLSLSLVDSGWRAELDARDVELAALRAFLGLYVADLDAALGGFEGDGRLTLRAQAVGVGGTLSWAAWEAAAAELEFSDPDGEFAGAGLGVSWSGRVKPRKAKWSVDSRAAIDSGELLLSPLYLTPGGESIRLSAELDWHPETGQLDVGSLKYSHGEIVELDADARLRIADKVEVETARVRTGPVALPGFYAGYLQPLLAETMLEDMEVDGTARIALDYQGPDAAHATIQLADVHLDDHQRRFGLHGLEGDLTWTARGPVNNSRLAWNGGYLLENLTLGPTRLALRLAGDSAELLESAELPLLDGKLLVDRLAIADLTADEPSVDFNGVLTPISMQAFSQVVGWPTLSGQFSGIIPSVSYRQGVLKVGGTLLMRVFGGDVRINGLRLDRPLGVLPTLVADVGLSNLDLETLTGTFAFGRITGKLDGYIHGLYLEDWRPIAFDARFETPEGDRSRHRISQKAVDNLSNLGGAGISGALSRSFLRFFEEFGYKRLGIGCRLSNGVCEMDGVQPAENGYYIVKGGGLPRIDVVGFNRRIDWNLLIEKLVEITESQGPVIK